MTRKQATRIRERRKFRDICSYINTYTYPVIYISHKAFDIFTCKFTPVPPPFTQGKERRNRRESVSYHLLQMIPGEEKLSGVSSCTQASDAGCEETNINQVEMSFSPNILKPDLGEIPIRRFDLEILPGRETESGKQVAGKLLNSLIVAHDRIVIELPGVTYLIFSSCQFFLKH